MDGQERKEKERKSDGQETGNRMAVDQRSEESDPEAGHDQVRAGVPPDFRFVQGKSPHVPIPFSRGGQEAVSEVLDIGHEPGEQKAAQRCPETGENLPVGIFGLVGEPVMVPVGQGEPESVMPHDERGKKPETSCRFW